MFIRAYLNLCFTHGRDAKISRGNSAALPDRLDVFGIRCCPPTNCPNLGRSARSRIREHGEPAFGYQHSHPRISFFCSGWQTIPTSVWLYVGMTSFPRSTEFELDRTTHAWLPHALYHSCRRCPWPLFDGKTIFSPVYQYPSG